MSDLESVNIGLFTLTRRPTLFVASRTARTLKQDLELKKSVLLWSKQRFRFEPMFPSCWNFTRQLSVYVFYELNFALQCFSRNIVVS